MRIIAGLHRGRRILPPATDTTRPITDRAKQSLFDVLSPRIDGAVVFDCFAGTGSMGLECLSRGAIRAYFFESDRSAVALLRQNIRDLQLEGASTIIASDLFRWFAHAEPVAADLIFLDPPYRFLVDRPADLLDLATRLASRHLAPRGVVIFRHDLANELPLPPLSQFDRRTYGSMAIDLLSVPT